MKYWPVPNSYIKNIPIDGAPGSFWENRRDRYHCGVDIYAPEGSEVISMDDGTVLDAGIFTNPKEVSYWNETKFVLIKNQDGIICKYAELGDIVVKANDIVKAGQLIGHVGVVLNVEKINSTSPKYIQEINKNNISMLHFEILKRSKNNHSSYKGGNWFGSSRPKYFLNPTIYFKDIFI